MQLKSGLGMRFRVSELGTGAIVLVVDSSKVSTLGCWQVSGQSPSTPGSHGTPELRASS